MVTICPDANWFLNLKSPIAIVSPCPATSSQSPTPLPTISQKRLYKKKRQSEGRCSASASPTTSTSSWPNSLAGPDSDSCDDSIHSPQPHIPVLGLEHNFESFPSACKIDYRTNPIKPHYKYQEIMEMAFTSSLDGKLTLSELYHWIQDNFAFFRQPEQHAWKKSIRHRLSRNNDFKKLLDEPRRNKYHLWTLQKDDCRKQQPKTVAAPKPRRKKGPKEKMTKIMMPCRKRSFQFDDPMDTATKRASLCEGTSQPLIFAHKAEASTGSWSALNLSAEFPANTPLPSFVFTTEPVPSTSYDSKIPPQDSAHLQVRLQPEQVDMPPTDSDFAFPDNFDLLQEMDVDCHDPAAFLNNNTIQPSAGFQQLEMDLDRDLDIGPDVFANFCKSL